MDANATPHRIRHYVYVDGQMIPRESTMRGDWPSDAKCSCGWETRTGGALRSYIAREVRDHKFEVKHGLWEPRS